MIIYEFEIAVLNHILVQVDNSSLNELTVFSTKNGNSVLPSKLPFFALESADL